MDHVAPKPSAPLTSTPGLFSGPGGGRGGDANQPLCLDSLCHLLGADPARAVGRGDPHRPLGRTVTRVCGLHRELSPGNLAPHPHWDAGLWAPGTP